MANPFPREFKDGLFWVVKIKLLDGSWKNFNTKIRVEKNAGGDPTEKSLRKALSARDAIQLSENRGFQPFEKEARSEARYGLKEVCEQYYESRVDLWVAKTAENRRDSIQSIVAHFGDTDVRTINNDAVRKFRSALMQRVSNATVNSKLKDLYAVLRFANEEYGLQLKIERVFLPVEDRTDDYLTEAELEEVLVAAERVYLNGESCRDFFEFLACSGMRRGEAIAAKRSWIKGELIVIPAWEMIDGRRVRVTKNGRSRRVPIWDRVAAILERRPKKGLLFPLATEAMSRRFQEALLLAGIERRLKLHNLRDTFTVMALSRGMRVQAVREIVGDELEVLMKHYAAVSSTDLVDAAKRAFGPVLVRPEARG